MIGFLLASFVIGVVVGIGVARYAWRDFYNEWKLFDVEAVQSAEVCG